MNEFKLKSLRDLRKLSNVHLIHCDFNDIQRENVVESSRTLWC